MEKYYQVFTNYILKNYDMEDANIAKKYLHSMRVASLMIELSKRLNLSEEDTILAFKIGLLHDLGRFREVQRNKEQQQVFNNLTFDHGAYSNKILFNDRLINAFDVDEKDYLVLRKALYYHGKKDLGNNLNEREKLFCQMIRDVDKLDIIYIRTGGNLNPEDEVAIKKVKRLQFTKEPSKKVLYNFFYDEMIDIKDLVSKGDSDSTILYLSFIKDLYFDESYEMAINNGYLDSLIKFIDVPLKRAEMFSEIYRKVKEREKKNDREKIRTHHS